MLLVVDKKMYVKRSSISNVVLHHLMILCARAFALAWHKLNIFVDVIRFICGVRMPVSACMGSNTHWVLDKSPNGKIRLPIGIEHNTHTRTDARRNNGALTHIHARTQSSLSYNQTPNRFGYTAVRAYCVIECACAFVWVFLPFLFPQNLRQTLQTICSKMTW